MQLRIGLCLIAVIIFSVMTTATVSSADSGETMANAMLTMMNAMGLGGSQTSPRDNLQPMWGNNGLPPYMTPWTQGAPWSQMSPWRTESDASLNGFWIGSNGEHLQIQNPNFYLVTERGRISGFLHLQGRMLKFIQPRFNLDLSYEYALFEGRLALYDGKGHLLLYRRVR